MGTKQINIRRVEPDDYRSLQEIHAQPRVVWGTLQTPFPSAEIWKARLASPTDGTFGLAACVDGRIVGSLSLAVPANSPRRRHVGEIGLAVHDAWQHRRVGSALMRAAVKLADRWLDLKRLELTVYTDNVPAIKLYENLGFEIEGTLRAYSFRDGRYADAYAMARLRPHDPVPSGIETPKAVAQHSGAG
jgi:putative acetyltransferase